MAVITEEPESPKSPPRKQPHSATIPPHSSATARNPFLFWLYFTLSVSLLTLFFVSFSPKDPNKWFLNLPPNLRDHYSKGRIFKVQLAPGHPQVEAFSIQDGPFKSDNRVLIVHGFGCSSYAFRGVVKSLGLKGVRAIALDLPGSGFSDKSVVVEEEVVGGSRGLSGIWDVYNEIREKGIFWGFDQMVEKGYVDFEGTSARVSKVKVVKPVELGVEEMGRVLSQVINEMGLAPVDLVLHDSALGLSASWISENARLVNSVVLLDSLSYRPALPLWAVGVPVIREVVLGVGFVFERILDRCCMKSGARSEAEAHRLLLKGREGWKSAIGMGKKVNYSLDLSEWGGLVEVKGLPMQVIWSNGSYVEWSEEGRWVASALPRASVVSHSGGPWPQEDSAEEIAELINEFISSLPKSTRQAEEEPIPERIQMKLDESEGTGSDLHHSHARHNHYEGHTHAHAGYADAYGLGEGWNM